MSVVTDDRAAPDDELTPSKIYERRAPQIPEIAAEINGGLIRAGIRVSELKPAERSLEEVFLQVTEESDVEVPAGEDLV